jgi:NADPH:quinone reductase-like Zn-dependent oxidoreductase
MLAIQYTEKSPEPLQLTEVPRPQAREGHCIIKVKYAALNRRDQWIRQGLYPGIRAGVTLGSDVCGVVEEGPDDFIGKRVVVNPNIGWGNSEKAQAKQYNILGMPVDGGLAEYLRIPEDKVRPAPEHLSDQEAAALPLAGMTAFRACFTRAAIKKGQQVLITGAGGGVAQMALGFCLKLGCGMSATSGQTEKIKKCLELGASAGFNYQDTDWYQQVKDDFDAVIDGSGGALVNDYLKVIRPGGNLVIYGATVGKTPKFDVHRLFWSQINVKGSTMASDQEFDQMLEFVQNTHFKPMIDRVYPVDQYLSAFDRFKDKDHLGKIIIGF